MDYQEEMFRAWFEMSIAAVLFPYLKDSGCRIRAGGNCSYQVVHS